MNNAYGRKTIHDLSEKEVRPKAREVDETSEFNWQAVRKGRSARIARIKHPGGVWRSRAWMRSALQSPSKNSAGAAVQRPWPWQHTTAWGPHHWSIMERRKLKQHWLPLVASGKGKLGSLALTEPGAGSDLQGGVKTKAVKCRERMGDQRLEDVDHQRIDRRIHHNPSPDRDLNGGSHSLSLILVPTDNPGIKIGPAEKKMGLHGSPTHAVIYDDVRVPLKNLIGERAWVSNKPWQRSMEAGSASARYQSALRKRLLNMDSSYAVERQAFGQAISGYEAIQWMLADAATEIEAARYLLYPRCLVKAAEPSLYERSRHGQTLRDRNGRAGMPQRDPNPRRIRLQQQYRWSASIVMRG